MGYAEGYVDSDGKTHHVATTRTIFRTTTGDDYFIRQESIHLERNIQFNDDIQYTLQSCIIHEGVQWGGHYISACRFNDKWYMQDDENVFEVDLKDKAGYYVLIYTLKNRSS